MCTLYEEFGEVAVLHIKVSISPSAGKYIKLKTLNLSVGATLKVGEDPYPASGLLKIAVFDGLY